MRGNGLGRPTAILSVLMVLVAACTEGLDSTGGPDDSSPPPTDTDGAYAYEDAEVRGIVNRLDGTPADGVDVTVVAAPRTRITPTPSWH